MRFKVLLIDDEPGALEGMQLWIDWEKLGFEVCGTCTNGAEGLKAMAELSPDLVVTDVNMPLMSGLEMIEEWRKSGNKNISFAIISGYSEFEYARKAMRYGITHYLLKPVEPEEAAGELRKIYSELLHEEEERQWSEMALVEEQVFLIRQLLEDSPGSEREYPDNLITLSAGREAWNICLIQTEPTMYAELRGAAAALISQEQAMFLIDLAMNRLGIVFGYSPDQGQADGVCQVLAKLAARYTGQRAAAAIGAPEESLLHLANCYKTAEEALKFKFYDPEYTGVISYASIEDRHFQYHYDPTRLVDNAMEALTLLNAAGYRETVTAEAELFRELLLAPEIVKKAIYHLMYKMKEHMEDSLGKKASDALAKWDFSALADSALGLNELLALLLSLGEECIDLLSEEQELKSQGIVQEINEYIREHYRERLTIKKLAKHFYLHPVYLGQLLMKKNGVGFNEWVHNLRIEEASRLLLENKLRNSEIAEQVGYVNYSQFLKQFEKRMGMSPGEYKGRN
ncbi:response regulator [Paenibacillus apis]|uniref:DNA-binding response regulator n=1 Tax=Paenibacillus apis TaxID=1792174 RepID=A0A920CIX5_9BACL|nr:response regulator [Paenibacillus apis]GIO42116.1 DNA-binding response regulator [Paenibacillus apis]